MTDKKSPVRTTRETEAENVLDVMDIITSDIPWNDYPHPHRKNAMLPGRKTLAVAMYADRLARGNDKGYSAQLVHELLGAEGKLHPRTVQRYAWNIGFDLQCCMKN
jgi:hypothetical protein